MDYRDRRKMFIVDLPHKKIGISFKHIFTTTLIQGFTKKARITHCAIFDLPDDFDKKTTKEPIKCINFGVSKCSENDNFCKETGRKVSLTRALLTNVHEFSTPEAKPLREIIWNAYRGRPRESGLPPNEGAPAAIEGVVVQPQKLLNGNVDDPTVH